MMILKENHKNISILKDFDVKWKNFSQISYNSFETMMMMYESTFVSEHVMIFNQIFYDTIMIGGKCFNEIAGWKIQIF